MRGVDLRELELALGGHPLGVALGGLREGLGVCAVVLGARHLVLQAVDAVHEAAQQRSRVAADLVVAQRQLVDPLPEHRHSVRAGDGREEGVEPRLERLVLEQPSGEGLRRGDPELLPGRLDRGLDLRAQHGGDTEPPTQPSTRSHSHGHGASSPPGSGHSSKPSLQVSAGRSPRATRMPRSGARKMPGTFAPELMTIPPPVPFMFHSTSPAVTPPLRLICTPLRVRV